MNRGRMYFEASAPVADLDLELHGAEGVKDQSKLWCKTCKKWLVNHKQVLYFSRDCIICNGCGEIVE